MPFIGAKIRWEQLERTAWTCKHSAEASRLPRTLRISKKINDCHANDPLAVEWLSDWCVFYWRLRASPPNPRLNLGNCRKSEPGRGQEAEGIRALRAAFVQSTSTWEERRCEESYQVLRKEGQGNRGRRQEVTDSRSTLFAKQLSEKGARTYQ